MTTSEVAESEPRRKRGRPRSSTAPEAIRRASAALFAERGFTATSVRDIAAVAGVDAAVVIRHFGSKEKLFLEVITAAPPPLGLVDGPLDTLGRAILRKLVGDDDSTVRVFATVLGALDRPDVRRYLEESTVRSISEPLAARLSGPDPRLRARLVGAQIAGLLMIVSLSGASSSPMRSPAVLDHYARALQVLIDEPASTR